MTIKCRRRLRKIVFWLRAPPGSVAPAFHPWDSTSMSGNSDLKGKCEAFSLEGTHDNGTMSRES